MMFSTPTQKFPPSEKFSKYGVFYIDSKISTFNGPTKMKTFVFFLVFLKIFKNRPKFQRKFPPSAASKIFHFQRPQNFHLQRPQNFLLQRPQKFSTFSGPIKLKTSVFCLSQNFQKRPKCQRKI